MKFIDTVNKKLQLLSEVGPGAQQPQAPGSAEPADATAPQEQQAPTPLQVDQQGKDEEGARKADKELCLQVVTSLLEKIKDKIRALGSNTGVEIADKLNDIYNSLNKREGDLNTILSSTLNTIKNEL